MDVMTTEWSEGEQDIVKLNFFLTREGEQWEEEGESGDGGEERVVCSVL
jgi:hypothetical protein